MPVCVRACVFVGQNKESIEKGGGNVTIVLQDKKGEEAAPENENTLVAADQIWI